MTNQLLLAALGFARRGWPVFPCAHKGKRPIIAGGFKNGFTDTDKINSTWDIGQPPNIGLVTGERSGLVVVDIDPRHNGPQSLSDLLAELGIEWDIFETTFRVITGSLGTHYYFKHPGGFVPCRVNIRPGVDIRADGGYVIAAPSIHENGRDYRVASETDPLNALPGALLDFILKAAEKPTLSDGTTEGLVVEGGRNDYLMRIAGALRRPGLHEDALSAALLMQNERVCNPPLADAEVRRIAKNIGAYQPSHPVHVQQLMGQEKPLVSGVPGALLDGDQEKPYLKATELMDQVVSYLTDERQTSGRATGMETFDKLMGGGKRLGELTAWHGLAKTGKNTLWHKFMHMWLNQGVPIGYACREISPIKDVIPNLLSLEIQKSAWKEKITPELQTQYEQAVVKWPLFFSRGYGYMPMDYIERWVKALHEQGVEYFFFDHLHFMISDPEDHREAAKLINRLKVMAQTLNIHIDIIVQPNRLKEGEKLSMHSLKGGAVINQTVDNLIILERSEDEDSVLEIKMELGRSKLVKRGTFYLQYNEITTDYIEVVKDKPTPPPTGSGIKPRQGHTFPQYNRPTPYFGRPKLVDLDAKRLDPTDD